jgi:hypothetical protein
MALMKLAVLACQRNSDAIQLVCAFLSVGTVTTLVNVQTAVTNLQIAQKPVHLARSCVWPRNSVRLESDVMAGATAKIVRTKPIATAHPVNTNVRLTAGAYRWVTSVMVFARVLTVQMNRAFVPQKIVHLTSSDVNMITGVFR